MTKRLLIDGRASRITITEELGTYSGIPLRRVNFDSDRRYLSFDQTISRTVSFTKVDRQFYTFEIGDKKCFLTTACVEAMGLSDDCRELTVLRAFRDGYMQESQEMRDCVNQYYGIAPMVVSRIKQKPDARQIFEGIYRDHIYPAVDLIEREDFGAAFEAYKRCVSFALGKVA